MKTKTLREMLCILFITGAVVSCKKKEVVVTPVVQTTNLTVNFSTSESFTFFRFSDSTVFTSNDSATNKWDFGIRQATIIINSHASGPGQAGVIIQNATYADVTTAPASGYAYDTSAAHLAIHNFTSWATYNQQTFSFTPIAGKTFIFKTADGQHYAKMEMLNVSYEAFVGPFPKHIIYRFRYTYQPNGTNSF